jgi:heme-degrading monooxygenase HmoA
MSHVRIGVYALTSGTAKEVGDQAREGMLSVFRGQPGFQAYGVAETREGKVVSVSLWDSDEEAEQANELAASWVKDHLADRIRLESTQIGDFLFYETSSPAGAGPA